MSQSDWAANYEFPNTLFMARFYQQREEARLMTPTVTNRLTLMQ